MHAIPVENNHSIRRIITAYAGLQSGGWGGEAEGAGAGGGGGLGWVEHARWVQISGSERDKRRGNHEGGRSRGQSEGHAEGKGEGGRGGMAWRRMAVAHRLVRREPHSS